MVAARQTPYMTRPEYLKWEHRQEIRHEYHDGVIVAMSGATPAHSSIGFNVGLEIGIQVKGSRCQGFDNDLRVYVPACNKYYYPDKSVVCGEPQYEEIAGLRALLNPTLVVEILSDSTERSDRREKRDCYRTLPSLQSYVLISQDMPHIDLWTPQKDGSWRLDVANSLEATVELPSIGCRLRLADVYARVPFAVQTTQQEESGTT